MFENDKNDKKPNEILVRGVIARFTFRNLENGFGIAKIKPDSGPEIAIVGAFPSALCAGSNIIARGIWQEHPKFGKQIKAFSVTEVAPTGVEAIERYLGSGGVKGIGEVLATRIVAHFGEQTLEIIDSAPERLREVEGIGDKKLEEILGSWDEKRSIREIMLFFQGHGIPTGLAMRIYSTYRNRTIELVKKDPYLLARDIWGIGFQTADRIALSIGLEQHSIERLRGGLAYSLKKASEDGNCYLSRQLVVDRTSILIEVEEEDLLNAALDSTILQGYLIEDEGRIYLPLLFEAEKNVAEIFHERLTRLSQVKGGDLSEILARNTVTAFETDSKIELSEKQDAAVRMSAQYNTVIVTGGPGCGKTTVIRAIVNLFKRAGLNIKLCAPTGRAAQRLAEVCDNEASTIHRLLKFDPIKREFIFNSENLLEIDVLIVDESSMIDILLASALLEAISANTRIIIVGDVDQLPSVGAGLFLADLLAVETIPRIKLDKIFRRSSESIITDIAHQINAGELPFIPKPDGATKADAYYVDCATSAEGCKKVESLVVDQIPKKFGFSGSEIMVLSPMNQGELGIHSLNRKLQALIIPEEEGKPSVVVGELTFRLGDRVCQRVNNYQLSEVGVFNGDQGTIIAIDSSKRTLIVKLWDGREIEYSAEFISQLDLAYALTIHRSQGSEVPCVVLVLHDSHTILLERQLIYTAVTRAKKLLIIVGTMSALETAVKRNRGAKRFTGLAERIKKGLKVELFPI